MSPSAKGQRKMLIDGKARFGKLKQRHSHNSDKSQKRVPCGLDSAFFSITEKEGPHLEAKISI